MNRRTFIQAISTFVAATVIVPKETLGDSKHWPEINWQSWNKICLEFDTDRITNLFVNGEDYTYNLDVKNKICSIIAVTEDGCFSFGAAPHSVKFKYFDELPDKFYLNTNIKVNSFPKSEFCADDLMLTGDNKLLGYTG